MSDNLNASRATAQENHEAEQKYQPKTDSNKLVNDTSTKAKNEVTDSQLGKTKRSVRKSS